MIEILVAMESLGIYKAWVCICIIFLFATTWDLEAGVWCQTKKKVSMS